MGMETEFIFFGSLSPEVCLLNKSVKNKQTSVVKSMFHMKRGLVSRRLIDFKVAIRAVAMNIKYVA